MQLIALSALLAALLPATPTDAAAADSLRGWKSLTLNAQESMLYTGSATFHLSEATHGPSGRPAVVFEIRSEAKLLGAIGFTERTTSWIDVETRRPLELLQIRPGDSARRTLFDRGSLKQTTWDPPVSGEDLPLSQWREGQTTSRSPSFADGSPLPESAWITDAYTLMYLLGEADLASGKTSSREFVTLTRRNLLRLRVKAGERRLNERALTDETRGSSRTLRLAERRLHLEPIGEGADGFKGILGMQGGVEIWVDETSGALLEIRGNAPGVGPATVSISSFRL